jgi:hypothetical protein
MVPLSEALPSVSDSPITGTTLAENNRPISVPGAFFSQIKGSFEVGK